MTRIETLIVAAVAITAGLLAAELTVFSNDSGPHCEEDEVAIHGGLEDWYDPDAPLECVAFDEFPEVHTYDEGFDAGFGYGLENGLADRIYDFAYDNGYGDALSDMANGGTEPAAPTATPESIPEARDLNERELAALVHAAFPDDPHMGDAVVWRETLGLDDWRDYVYGGAWSATGDCGLMQINWASHAARFAVHGWTQADCFNPARNLAVAREIYDDDGCGAWTTCW